MLPQGVVVEPVFGHNPGPEVLDDDVRMFDQLADECRATVFAQVDTDVLFTDILLDVVRAQTGSLTAPESCDVALGRFDLDHVDRRVVAFLSYGVP